MKLANTIKKFGKPVVGVVLGLSVAGFSVMKALHSNDEDDYDDDYEVEPDDEDGGDIDEHPADESTDEPE